MVAKIGIIGGSGLYDIEGIANIKEVDLDTPYGKPSDKLITGSLDSVELVFLPRHAKGHRINPSKINYRANIFAMKKLGVERIISLSACGSLKEEFKPLDFVIVDQFVDRTNQARPNTFFDSGGVVHVALAHPVCSDLSKILFETASELKLTAHPKGTYLCMEGPAFSTKAESELYRSWGMDIIGMTNMTEARLAREAEICYSSLAAVTDYDCWHETEEAVTVEMILANLLKNVENSKKILKSAIKNIPPQRQCSCKDALKDAIVTDLKLVAAQELKKLDIIIGKYIK